MTQYNSITDNNILKNFPKENNVEESYIIDFEEIEDFFTENKDVLLKRVIIQVNNIPDYFKFLNKKYLFAGENVWLSTTLDGKTLDGKNNYSTIWIIANINYLRWCSYAYDEQNNVLFLSKKYKENKELYKIYDNYFAINIDKIADLPIDSDEIEIEIDADKLNYLNNQNEIKYEIIKKYTNGSALVKLFNPSFGIPITGIDKLDSIYVIDNEIKKKKYRNRRYNCRKGNVRGKKKIFKINYKI